jgi:hypothetical protein
MVRRVARCCEISFVGDEDRSDGGIEILDQAA